MLQKISSIRFQIGFVLSVIILLVFWISLTNFFKMREMKLEMNEDHFNELIDQSQRIIAENCNDLNAIIEKIAYNKMIQNYLHQDDLSLRLEARDEIISFLASFINLKYGIKDIAIIPETGDAINVFGNVTDLQPFAETIPEKVMYHYTGIVEMNLVPAYKRPYFIVGINVYSTSDFRRRDKMGTVLLTFAPQAVFHFMRYGENNFTADVLVYDRNHQVVFSSLPDSVNLDELDKYSIYSQRLERITLQKQPYYVQYGRIDMLDGEIVFLVPASDLMEGMDELLFMLVSMSLIAFVIIISTALIMTRNIMHPIHQLKHYMQSMDGGNYQFLKSSVSVNGALEMKHMADQLNKMIQEINTLTRRLMDTSSRLYESKIGRQQAELAYMYSQINPHFLFNTLESIKGCAVEEDAEKTFQMVTHLGKIFRYAARGGSTVPLREELAVMNSYMTLQKIRFDQRLTYHEQVAEASRDVPIPKMILQPLFENAVIHGLEENLSICISLRCEKGGDTLILTVSDNGQPISEEKWQALTHMMEGPSDATHVGLNNVHKRIRFMYGSAYGVEIKKPARGFTVVLRLPCHAPTPIPLAEWDGMTLEEREGAAAAIERG